MARRGTLNPPAISFMDNYIREESQRECVEHLRTFAHKLGVNPPAIL